MDNGYAILSLLSGMLTLCTLGLHLISSMKEREKIYSEMIAEVEKQNEEYNKLLEDSYKDFETLRLTKDQIILSIETALKRQNTRVKNLEKVTKIIRGDMYYCVRNDCELRVNNRGMGSKKERK